MAHTFQIVYGSTTLNLNTGSNVLLEYVPKSPNLSTIDTNEILTDGGERPSATRRNITESAQILLRPTLGTSSGSTASAMQTTERAINRAFEFAKRRQSRGLGDKVYIQYKPDGGASTFRSEILTGKVDIIDESLDWRWTGASVVMLGLAFTRRFYWEGPEINVPLTNGNGANVTIASIMNHYDVPTGSPNFVTISASDVVGDLPAPAKIQVRNTHATDRYDVFWIGQNVLSSPSSFDYVIEGEDSSTGTTASAATYSNGETQTASTSGDTEATMFTWTISASQVEHGNGNYFHAMARFGVSTDVTDTKFRFKFQRNSVDMWAGQQIQPKSTDAFLIRDLGIIQLPPWGNTNLSAFSTISLVLTGQQTGGFNISLDFLHLFPVDGFRKIDGVTGNSGPTQNEWIIDDGINHITYAQNNISQARRAEFVTEGIPIFLRPNELQRLYFLIHGTTSNSADIDYSADVRVDYRPRVLII